MNTARQANHHAPHSNLTEMYPGIYQAGVHDPVDGPNLPTGPLNTLLGFELETYQIPLDQLLPSKKVEPPRLPRRLIGLSQAATSAA